MLLASAFVVVAVAVAVAAADVENARRMTCPWDSCVVNARLVIRARAAIFSFSPLLVFPVKD